VQWSARACGTRLPGESDARGEWPRALFGVDGHCRGGPRAASSDERGLIEIAAAGHRRDGALSGVARAIPDMIARRGSFLSGRVDPRDA